METVVNKIISKLSTEEMEKIRTTSGIVVMIVKIIEKVHAKKKLSYEDSRRLTSLIIDVLVTTMKGRDISPELIFYLEHNKNTVEMLVSESIDIWHSISGLCQKCYGGKQDRARKSITMLPEQPAQGQVVVRTTHV